MSSVSNIYISMYIFRVVYGLQKTLALVGEQTLGPGSYILLLGQRIGGQWILS
jgi:hypothetical protein